MLKSKNMFSYGNEDHTEESTKELSEQGAVSHADAEEVVAPVTPEADVTEAGDDVGQATPKEEISGDHNADITQTTTVAETTDGAEVSELLEEGQQAQSIKDEIVEAAQAEIGGGDAGAVSDAGADSTDANGNQLTPEQSAVNAEEEQTEEVVEDEAEEEAAAKDIHQEATEVEENADENLGDAINDDSTDGDLGGDTAESSDASQDGDAFGDDSTGDDSGDTGIDADLDDDTPLEGAETEVGDSTTEETTDGADDTSDSSAAGNDSGSETSAEDTGTTGDESTETTDESEGGTEEGADTVDVEGDTEAQNEAAEVTDDATGAADTETDIADAGAGESEAEVGGDDAGMDIDDDTPLEGAEPVPSKVETDTEAGELPEDQTESLDVNAETPLTEGGGDMGDSDGSAATVEESITEDTSEDLQDGVDAVAEATAEVEEDSGESTDGEVAAETPLATSGDETGEGTEEVEGRVVEEAPPADATVSDDAEVSVTEDVIDEDGGQIVEEGEANFDDGEVDVKDVDMGTTDEEVEEAMNTAAEVGEWGDKEEKEGELGEKTIEELQKEKESLETFRVLLEDGISNEQYPASLLAYMNAQVEPLRRKLAKLDANFGKKLAPRVALEAYGQDTDLAWHATLESFRGMISRVSTLTTSVIHGIEQKWSRNLVDKVLTRADALDKQIDLTITQLANSGYTTKELAAGGYLATNETNLVKAVAADLALVTDIAIKGIKASEQLQATVCKGVNDIIQAGDEKDITKALDELAKLKPIKSAFPSAAFDKGLLGGYKLEIREGSGSTRTEKIEALGHTGIPVGKKAERQGDTTKYNLTKGDIANLLKLAKTYLGIARKLANTTGDRAIALGTKVRTTRNRALPIAADTRVRGDEHGVDAAATAMKLLAQSHLDLYKFLTKHIVDVVEAICGVAGKAVK